MTNNTWKSIRFATKGYWRDEIRDKLCILKLRDETFSFATSSFLGAKNNDSCHFVTYFVTQNMFYPRSKDPQVRASDEPFYLLFYHFSFHTLSMSPSDNTANFGPKLTKLSIAWIRPFSHKKLVLSSEVKETPESRKSFYHSLVIFPLFLCQCYKVTKPSEWTVEVQGLVALAVLSYFVDMRLLTRQNK